MAIKTDNLSSDITLELDEDVISLADFKAACDAFSGLIKEVSKQVKPDAKAGAWSVKVYEGSIGIGVSAMPSLLGPELMSEVRLVLITGLEMLARGQRPVAFTDNAIEFAGKLASTFKRKPLEPNIRIWSGQTQSISVGRVIAKTAKELLEPAYEEEASVEGRLEKLDGHDKLQFVVYDMLEDRAIRCEVDSKLLSVAWENFQKRVEVVGKVRFRRDGHAVSVKAREIISFPSPDQIPSLDEMRRLLSAA